MELVAPVLIVAAVVLAAVWATRILWFCIKVAAVAAVAYLLVSHFRPDLIPKEMPKPKIVTSPKHYFESKSH